MDAYRCVLRPLGSESGAFNSWRVAAQCMGGLCPGLFVLSVSRNNTACVHLELIYLLLEQALCFTCNGVTPFVHANRCKTRIISG